MAGPAVLFREIHRLRRFARDLQEQIARVPVQLKAHQNRVKRQEDQVKETQDAIKRLKVDIHQKEVTLRTTHGQVAKHEKQLQEAGSTKEYKALETEIAAEKEALARLEDEILTAMTESEEKAGQIPALEKAVQDARADYARVEAEAESRRAGLDAQLAEAQGQIEAAEAGIPAQVRGQYNRVIAAKGPDALAAIRDRNCSACYTAITAQDYNELLQEHFVTCKICGRILYLPE